MIIKNNNKWYKKGYYKWMYKITWRKSLTGRLVAGRLIFDPGVCIALPADPSGVRDFFKWRDFWVASISFVKWSRIIDKWQTHNDSNEYGSEMTHNYSN